MNELQNFNFEGNEVPVKLVNDQLVFDAETVAKSVGLTTIAKSGNAVVRWNRVRKYLNSPEVEKGDFITEPQMYRLAIKANNKTAERFQDWVTNEVLPSIRKHGAYLTDEKIEEALLNPDTIISLATKLKDEREKVEVERNGRLIAEQRVEELQPKADYYDQILSNKGVVTVTSIAKNYGMTAPELNKLLNQLGVQYSQSGSWYLYKKYQKNGYTHTIPVPYSHRDGRPDIKPQTKWTQKGHIFVYQLLKEHGILPMIEMKDESAV
ncbi:phage antirepressor KilAC domain-containing protein [Pediococcus pentosaceus]|uniref:phage antirepressor KilAC domain-containing protein n=1 Tax=Pediococcus pentosaceus TaxID=1255 RepID=UPI0023B019ED|nr:phage antirepressor KilAC domain-containing protein [Pediococcus pentosaceus]MDE7510874.1 phage antirepressor KilAC domain-containing protein [Pediococcus pentosaceus]